jgi:photosystem II stability/assembly factor-like uncharacterized protein
VPAPLTAPIKREIKVRHLGQLIVAVTAILLPAVPRLAAQPQAEPVWSSIGPDGGALAALAEAPGMPQVLYTVTAEGGIWRSESGGRQWAFAGRGLSGYLVTALAVDAKDAEVVYAAAWSKGVLKSADGGSSWTAANQGLPSDAAPGGVLALAADPYHPGPLYAGTGDGVYKSLDGAATWQPANHGLAGDQIHAFAFTPAALFAACDHGVAKSVNGGVSWQLSRLSRLGETVHALVADPSRPAVLYGAAASQLWKSADGGGTWSRASSFADFVSLLATDAGGAVYVGTPLTVFRSTDGAATFRALPPAPFVSPAGNPGMLLAARSVPGTLLAATSGGLFRTQDGGISWQPFNRGLRGLSVLSLAVDPRDASAVYAGVTTGLLVGRHRDAAWSPRFAGLGLIQPVEAPFLLAVDPAGSGTIYRSLLIGLSRSFNAGRRWHDLRLPNSCLVVSALALDPSAPRTVYTGGDNGDAFCQEPAHAYKSTDAGNTWTTLSIGVVDGLYVDPSSPETVYATSEGLMKSGDGGMTWSSAGAGLPQVVYSLAIDPQSSGTLYAATLSGLFKSTDGAGTWLPAGAGLPPGAVSTVVVSPREPGTVYAGIRGVGVFRSTDGAASWSALSAGLPRRVFTGLVVIAPSDPSILYAATAGNSIYELQLR